MVGADYFRGRFQRNPSGLQIERRDGRGGVHPYTAVTAEMTGVLDASGNLLLTTLFHVPAHLCRMGSPAIIHNACSNQNKKLHIECQEESTQKYKEPKQLTCI